MVEAFLPRITHFSVNMPIISYFTFFRRNQPTLELAPEEISELGALQRFTASVGNLKCNCQSKGSIILYWLFNFYTQGKAICERRKNEIIMKFRQFLS